MVIISIMVAIVITRHSTVCNSASRPGGRPYTLRPTASAKHYGNRKEGCQLNQCHLDCLESYHEP